MARPAPPVPPFRLRPSTVSDPATRHQELRAQIAHHEHLYRVEHAPEISDQAFDALVKELEALEKEHPALA
ncbi:MAG: DNA ligase LigA-related protein, partial [Verrucomicrobiota bacterium]